MAAYLTAVMLSVRDSIFGRDHLKDTLHGFFFAVAVSHAIRADVFVHKQVAPALQRGVTSGKNSIEIRHMMQRRVKVDRIIFLTGKVAGFHVTHRIMEQVLYSGIPCLFSGDFYTLRRKVDALYTLGCIDTGQMSLQGTITAADAQYAIYRFAWL